MGPSNHSSSLDSIDSGNLKQLAMGSSNHSSCISAGSSKQLAMGSSNHSSGLRRHGQSDAASRPLRSDAASRRVPPRPAASRRVPPPSWPARGQHDGRKQYIPPALAGRKKAVQYNSGPAPLYSPVFCAISEIDSPICWVLSPARGQRGGGGGGGAGAQTRQRRIVLLAEVCGRALVCGRGGGGGRADRSARTPGARRPTPRGSGSAPSGCASS